MVNTLLDNQKGDISYQLSVPKKGTSAPRYTGTIPDAFKKQEEMAWNEYQRNLGNTGEYFFGRLSKNYKNQRNLAYANYQNVINQILANDAGTMMSVYRQAGLNPNLAISGGLSGSAATADAYQLPESDGTGFMNVASGLAGLVTSGFGAVATRAGIGLVKEQITGQKLANQFAGLDQFAQSIEKLRGKVFTNDEADDMLRTAAKANYQNVMNGARITNYQAEKERIGVDIAQQNYDQGVQQLKLLEKQLKRSDLDYETAASQLEVIRNEISQLDVTNAIRAADLINKQLGNDSARVNNGVLEINYKNLLDERKILEKYKYSPAGMDDYANLTSMEVKAMTNEAGLRSQTSSQTQRFYNNSGPEYVRQVLGLIGSLISKVL